MAEIKICAGQTPVQKKNHPTEDDKAIFEKVNQGPWRQTSLNICWQYTWQIDKIFLSSTKQSDDLVLLKWPKSSITFLSAIRLYRLISGSSAYLFSNISNITVICLQNNRFPSYVYFQINFPRILKKLLFSELNLFHCTFLIILWH